MFFSVIIPVFKRTDLLKRALTSVFNQSFKDFECLVVIDGCDEDYSFLKKEFSEVHWITCFPNKGVSFARNLGAKLSSGTYLTFLDSDDEWLHFKLQKQKEYLDQNPVLWLHSNEEWYHHQQWVNQGKRHQKQDVTFERSLETCLVSPSTVCLERNFFLKFQFDETLKACEDYDLWLRMLLCEKPSFLEEALSRKHAGHEDQLSKQHSLDFYRIQSLKKIYHESKNDKILSVLLKKYEIYIQGGQRRSKDMTPYQREYQDLKKILN